LTNITTIKEEEMTEQKIEKINVEQLVAQVNQKTAYKQYDKISDQRIANLVRTIATEKNVYVIDLISVLMEANVIMAIKKEIKFQNS
jgi:hypothetical protein